MFLFLKNVCYTYTHIFMYLCVCVLMLLLLQIAKKPTNYIKQKKDMFEPNTVLIFCQLFKTFFLFLINFD